MAILFVPALYTYFGLTGPAKPVFVVVLPALVAWFLVLSAAFRLRLLDRILGLDSLGPAVSEGGVADEGRAGARRLRTTRM
ncbi:hypothetical protein GCM10023215_00550 [Pseudonocardia yuanmonensis]|uniref:Uncharacterized protein n=1 Tax=Pseudonocardia yuanmonensis TaxID=1095914 RepID=A0ABP8VXM7_9PSEU